MWQVLLLSVQTQSPKPGLTTLVFFCSALTPQHFPYVYTIGNMECKGQAYYVLLQLAQTEAAAITQRETKVNYTPLVFNTAIITNFHILSV